MKLSYSSYNTYKQCPKKYHLEVTDTEPDVEPNAYFKLYGLLIENFFKLYSNNYTKNGIILTDDQVKCVLNRSWKRILEENKVDWKEPFVTQNSDEIFQDVYQDTLKNMKVFDFWKYAKSEVSMDLKLKKSNDTLKCRLDFIIDKPDGTVEILDGKGTYKMDKTVDVEQLYFYILMYYIHYKKLPDKAGFLYYKFQTIHYIDFDLKTIMDFKDKLAIVKRAIKSDDKFEAKIGLSKQCKWCSYRYNCKELIAVRKEKAEKKKSTIPFDSNGEVISFSMKGLFDEGSD